MICETKDCGAAATVLHIDFQLHQSGILGVDDVKITDEHFYCSKCAEGLGTECEMKHK